MRSPNVGDVFAQRYTLTGVLGEGGFATVFDARDTIGRRVAIKVLKPTEPAQLAEQTARFQRELLVLTQLRDPATVQLFDHGTWNGHHFMVFEHVPGHDLRQILTRLGTLDHATATRLLRQLLGSLGEAHQLGLLHRDLKPENIRIFERSNDPWAVKLLDFGIARPMVGSSQPVITRTGELIGTPRYMSPEQITEAALTATSDLYSLGLVILEAVHGYDALPGDSWGAQLERLVDGYDFFAEREARHPLDRVLRKMTARDPAARFRSAAEVLKALDTGIVHATRSTSRDVSPTVAPPSAARLKWSHVIVAVVLAAIVGGLAVNLGTRDTHAPPRSPSEANRSGLFANAAPVLTVEPTVAPIEPDAEPADVEPAAPLPEGCGRKVPPRVSLSHIPPSYDRNTPMPLVVMLHDDAQSPDVLLDESEFQAALGDLDALLYVPNLGTVVQRTAPNRSIDIDVSTLFNGLTFDEVRTSIEQLIDDYCIDDVFLVSLGVSGQMTESLSCDPWVSGAALIAYRAESYSYLCAKSAPRAPVPYIEIAPIDSVQMPKEGGKTCNPLVNSKLSISAAEQRWVERNECDPKSRRELSRDATGTCYTWDCATETQFCHIAGGHGWPGPNIDRVRTYGTRCTHEPATGRFPASDTIVAFIKSVLHRDKEQP